MDLEGELVWVFLKSVNGVGDPNENNWQSFLLEKLHEVLSKGCGCCAKKQFNLLDVHYVRFLEFIFIKQAQNMWHCAACRSDFLSKQLTSNDLLHFCKGFYNVSVHLDDLASHLGKNWIGAKTFSRTRCSCNHQKLEAFAIHFKAAGNECLDTFYFFLTEAKFRWDCRAIEEVKCFCLA